MAKDQDWRSRAAPITNKTSEWRNRAQAVSLGNSDWRARAVVPEAVQEKEPEIGRLEALGRGLKYGAFTQPTNVIGAALASALGPEDLTFNDALGLAKERSLTGRTEQAKEERPGFFTGGEIAGNIALTALPAAKATSLVGAAAPALSKVPMLGGSLANIARGAAASRGAIGIPLGGAIQGSVQSLATEGDVSGALPGAIGAGLVGGVGKIVKPVGEGAISAARKGFTNTLQKIGIDDLTPGQLTGGNNLQLIDSTLDQMLPTANAARRRAEGQLRKFTSAALKKAGIDADELTPQVREMAEKNFNKKYSELIDKTNVKIDDDLLEKVIDVFDKNIDKLPTNTKPIVKSYVDDILKAGDGLSGKTYQIARSQMSRQANSMLNSDPFTANVLRDLRNALDEAAERSLPKAKQGAWRELNKQYANFKILNKAISRPSNNSLEGLLSPAALNSVIETANKSKSTRGYSELFDLARSGRAVLTDSVPNSGTAQRMLAQQLLTAGASGGAIGTGVYATTKDPETALYAALLGTLGAPLLAQKALGTKAAQTYFTRGIPALNQIATPTARQLGAQLTTGLTNER